MNGDDKAKQKATLVDSRAGSKGSLPTTREGVVSAAPRGEVRARCAVKLTAVAASYLSPEPFQANLEPVTAHAHGGNAPSKHPVEIP